MNNHYQPEQLAQPSLPQPTLNKKLSLHKETIKELTDRDLRTVAGGTSSTITIILISLREHVCL